MRKIAIITGGTRGIGRAAIEKFASADWDIITCSRSAEDLRTLEKELSQIYPYCKFHYWACDLSKREDIRKFLQFVERMNRKIDLLVNNTGIYLPGKTIDEEEGNLEKLIETNLYSAYHLTRGIVQKMIDNQYGDIINISSVAGIKAYPNGGSYSISKYAMEGFNRNLREETKDKGIRVTTIIPGAVKTSTWDGVDIPDERFIDVKDVAEMIFDIQKLSRRTVIEEVVIRPQLGDL